MTGSRIHFNKKPGLPRISALSLSGRWIPISVIEEKPKKRKKTQYYFFKSISLTNHKTAETLKILPLSLKELLQQQ